MLPILQLGPLALQTPLLLLLIGLWVAMSLGARHARTFNVEGKTLDDLVLLSILAGLAGGRLFYILRFPTAFVNNPTSILVLNPELFMASGGLLTGAILFLIILQRRKLNFWRILDSLTLPLAVMAVFIAVSHLASGAVFGLPTSLPWAIDLWGAERHPTQAYEIVAAAIILAICWRRYRYQQKIPDEKKIQGTFFLFFVILSTLSWIILETFRSGSMLIFGNLRLVQAAGLIVLVTSFYLLRERQKITIGEEG